jgi:hypothetical protein
MLERQVKKSCVRYWVPFPRSPEQPKAIVRYRSLALQWLSETLAFNASMKGSIGRCIVNDIAKRPCSRTNTHLWFSESCQQCSDDPDTAADLYLMSAVDELGVQPLLCTA